MLEFILGAVGAGYVCKCIADSAAEKERKRMLREQATRIYLQSENDYLRYQNSKLRYQNKRMRLNIHNHQQLLNTFDKINKFAKRRGYKGAVDFFYDLVEYYDRRFISFERFLYKVKCVRNDVAHHGKIYEIDNGFLNKLQTCWSICNHYKSLPPNVRMVLPYNCR